MIIKDNKVGIGTDDPENELSVVGDISSEGILAKKIAIGTDINTSTDLLNINNKVFIEGDISCNGRMYISGNIGVKWHSRTTGTSPNEQIVSGLNALDISGILRCTIEPQWMYNNGGINDFSEDLTNQHVVIKGGVIFQPYTGYTGANDGLTFDSVVAINYDILSDANNDASGKQLIVNGDVFVNGTITQNTSDQRIKNNINDVNNSEALQIIKNIPCKQYEYISKNIGIEYGFIAQDVKKYFPNAVTIRKNILIPSEYREINTNFTEVFYNELENKLEDNRTYTENGKELTKIKYKIVIEDLDNNSMDSKYRFYLDKQLKGYKDLKPIETPKTFLFDSQFDYLFVFGKYVDDFNALDKNQIFSLHHSGIQELSKIQEIKQSELVQLKSENNNLKAEVVALKEQMDNILERLNNSGV